MKTLLAFLAGIAAAVSVRAAATTTITNTHFMKFQATLRPSNTSITNREPT